MKTLIFAIMLCVAGSSGFPMEGYAVTKSNPSEKPLVVADTAYDSCHAMYAEASQYLSPLINQDQKAFDTLKKFIESCPFNENAPHAFGMLNGVAGSVIPEDTFAWLAYRQWLESVLYLNTVNPEYFCACVEAISETFYSNSDTGRNYSLKGPNWPLAVYRWLILNTTCDTPNLVKAYNQARFNQWVFWSEDSTAGPLDTTLPTMAQLGLDTLLARHRLYEGVSDRPQSIILNATASPNPVSTGTTITFGINQEAYVKINLFDLLGHDVTSPGYEGLFAPGNPAVPLSLHGLPGGTYYARIVSAYGSVASVKLVKE